MVTLTKKIVLIVLTISIIILSGCSTRYVCYDGEVKRNQEDCPIVEQPTMVQRQAEQIADAFASSYGQALSATHRRISTYREGTNWYSEILFTNVREGTVDRVKIKISERTVECISGCEYLEGANIKEPELNQTETTNETNNNETYLI